MRFNGTKTAALVFLAMFSSTVALSHGKKDKAHSKAVKECTDKGGTWNKKAKKCDPAKDAAAAQETASPTETAPTSEPAPAGEAAPSNP